MLKLVAKLPLDLLYGFSAFFNLVVYHLVRYRRKVVSDNLAKSFPEVTNEERKKIEKAFYRHFVDTSIEIFKAANMSEHEISQRVEFVNIEVLQPVIDSGQSMILLSAHSSNWEWLLLSLSVRLPIPLDAVYKPLSDKAFDKDMFETRSRFGVDPIDMDRFAKEVIKRKGTQRAYCILADQRPSSKTKSHETTFMNQPTKFFVGPETIAQFVKIPIIYVHMTRKSQGYYQVDFEVLAQPPYDSEKDQYPVTERYVRQLEKHIKNHPENWLWSHRRWRNRRQERLDAANLEK